MMSDQIADVFASMGWEVAEGPVVEAEWLNFDALNLGPDHPARTMQDTFWTDPPEHHVVLRTHTSPVQVRTMLTPDAADLRRLPRARSSAPTDDATHSPMFHQVEGLVVDEGITLAAPQGRARPLRGGACSATGSPTRFRPSYFPFVEPGAEVDLVCFVCRGCDSDQLPHLPVATGWIEFGGCGIVNPRAARRAASIPRLHRLRVRHGPRAHR